MNTIIFSGIKKTLFSYFSPDKKVFQICSEEKTFLFIRDIPARHRCYLFLNRLFFPSEIKNTPHLFLI